MSSWATCSSAFGKPTFIRCTFSGNRASYTGGGMSTFGTQPTLVDCTFIGNSSIFVGGGLYDGAFGATLSNCTFVGNTASYGGGIFADGVFQWFAQLELTNCIFTGNSADLDGGGLYLNDSLAALANCTVVGNSAPHGPALAFDSEDQASPSNTVVTNSILWNGGNDIWNNDDSVITLTYSNLPGGWPGAGNIAADPLFLDADGPDDIPGTEDDNLRLMPGSPGIDAGNNDAVPEDTDRDFDGAPRFVDDPDTVDTGSGTPPIVDLGAHEFADCNDNDVTDWADIAGGTSADCTGNGVPDECEPDCNSNGVADSCDIAEGTSTDCNANGVPDECEPDCNSNGVADGCDIAGGTSEDCNRNEVPDECDIADGTSEDDNQNDVPDECERDCNDNGVWDSEDIAVGTSQDCNDNLVPDECDIADGTSADSDHNGVPDECEPIIYVDKENCTWPGTGTITDPFCKIQHAIDVSVSGDTVLVSDGMYTSTDNTELDFSGRAITVRSKNGPENCIIYGSDIYHAFVFANGETADSRVEGFTIRNTLAGFYSGSIMCIASSPTIHDCVFWNTPTNSILLLEGSNPTISNCSIIDAGGIRCESSHPVIRDCLFLGARGDAVECHEASAPLILNSAFLAGTGDGIALIHGSSPTIANCTIAYNDDCGVFVNPVAPGPWHTRILNCTIVNNGIGTGGHGSRYGIYIGQGEKVTIGNCIVRNNVPDDFYLWGTPEVNVTYSNIEGGWPGEGNVDIDPLFIDPENYDFRPSGGSPSIDAGDNDNVAADVLDLDGDGDIFEPVPFDLDGAPRFWDHPGVPDTGSGTPPLVDMGAHEYRDCNDNGLNDSSEIDAGTSQDCNENCIPDDCDLAAGTSGDCDGAGNGIPDECEPDCNENGAADSCDLLQGTSVDCDANGVPDECQPDCDDDAIPDVCELPPFGSSADCNANTVPDECDIDQGTSPDCNDNTVPDECDLEAGTSADCNENAVPDECDIAGGTSVDYNGNGVPDECEFNTPIEAAPPDNVPKNRYVSFNPNNAEVSIGFQVEMTASTYFPGSLGVVGWVGEPDENGIARVVDQPFFAETWPAVVHLGDCPVVPAAAYALRATMDGITLGEALEVETIARPTPKYWADVAGEFGGTEWSGPNGEVNMDDVMAAVQKFQQLSTAPPLIWVDVDGEAPNAVMNFTDIMRIVQGFKGEPYPFSDPAACP